MVTRARHDFSPADAARLLAVPGYRTAMEAGLGNGTPGRVVVRKVKVRGVDTLVYDAWDVRPVLLRTGPPILLRYNTDYEDAVSAAAALPAQRLYSTVGMDLSAAFPSRRGR